MMTAKCSRLRHRAFGIATIFVSILLAASCLVLPGGVAVAQKSDAPEKEFEDFDGNNFDHSTTIDNPWFPLKVGMRWVHRGSTTERGKRVGHRLGTVVTDLTKGIDGVRTGVLWVEDYKEGKLDEAELALFAQDKDGNVWGLGEHAEQLKYYARGIGKVRVGWRGEGEKLQEVLELTEFSQLGPEALAAARAAALKLEKSAYNVSKDVYGATTPSEHLPSAQTR